jgi:hypothetical protein
MLERVVLLTVLNEVKHVKQVQCLVSQSMESYSMD